MDAANWVPLLSLLAAVVYGMVQGFRSLMGTRKSPPPAEAAGSHLSLLHQVSLDLKEALAMGKWILEGQRDLRRRLERLEDTLQED